MSQQDPDEINRLIGRLTDLQEAWEADPGHFYWGKLEALAREGAHAYNEEAGPSFHALALDGIQHSEFHERFLGYSIQAGFDPFRLTRQGANRADIPVIDHEGLAEAARSNPVSQRMRNSLMELARARFQPLVRELQSGKKELAETLLRTMEHCAESIPLDLLQEGAPELVVSPENKSRPNKLPVNPLEARLTSAEMTVDITQPPYG